MDDETISVAGVEIKKSELTSVEFMRGGYLYTITKLEDDHKVAGFAGERITEG